MAAPLPRRQVIQEKLHHQASQLTDIAHQHGLLADDIDACIIASLEQPRTLNFINIRRALYHWFGKLLRGTILLTVVLVCIGVFVSCHKPSRIYVGQIAFNSSYPIMRMVRHISLPLARRFDFTWLYYSECALPNPFFQAESSIDCLSCKHIKHIPDLNQTPNQYLDHPFISQDPSINTFTFDELKSWYWKNEKTFGLAREDHIQSSNPFIQKASDLFTEGRSIDDMEKAPFSLEWRAGSAGSVRLVRNLCGKPSFIPSETEVLPEMFLIIDSSSSHAHYLPRPSFQGLAWVSQASGARELTLSPVFPCKDNCTEVSTVLEAGNVLFFDSRHWLLQSFPFGSSVSIACLGSFV